MKPHILRGTIVSDVGDIEMRRRDEPSADG
jgi:hypothetical protein